VPVVVDPKITHFASYEPVTVLTPNQAPGKEPTEVVQAIAERVRATAVAILDRLDTRQVGDGTPPGLTRDTGQTVEAESSGPAGAKMAHASLGVGA